MIQIQNTGEPSKKLHPFFTKPDPRPPADDIPPTAPDYSTSPPVSAASEVSAHEINHEEVGRKRQQVAALEDESEPKKRRRKRKSKGTLTGAILNHLTRPRPAAAAAEENVNEGVNAKKSKIPSPPLSEESLKHDDRGEGREFDTQSLPSEKQSEGRVTRKKTLKFDPKTGKFGSPPRPDVTKTTSRIVCIKYGKNDEDQRRIGERITQILQGTTSTHLTHPFFSKGKADGKAGDARPLVEKRSIFLSTPVSPRKPKAAFNVGKALHFGIQSTGVKVPGAMYPMWPPQGMTHVRGDDTPQFKPSTSDVDSHRKFKGLTTTVAPQESLLRHVTDSMDIPSVRKSLTTDAASQPPSSLRLPRKHFESGRQLRNRIRSQIQARFSDKPLHEDCDLSPDELGPPASRAHPGLEWLYKLLETQLSAYDRSCCENAAWTQKYAPTNAAQVLQRGREAVLLRDWLQTLRVQSIEPVSAEEKDHEKEGCARKRRKKNKLEGFIVEDEDESDTMYEISDDDENNDDDDDDSDIEKGPRHRKRTIMREGNLSQHSKNQKRLANAILLSGPHGCGKTAAVYAAARELDFEVFEINPGSRRSGKDILEKVGDMTRNHLVQRNRQHPETSDADELANDDIKSGAQGTMTSFFKPQQDKPKKRGRPKKGENAANEKEKESHTKAPTQSHTHKQSLILVEEVDILFDEDKQFWASLSSLIAQSKRPFIMTCNDEALVPIYSTLNLSLSLHGILRFQHPPAHLAVDACLLIAANEGHALSRNGVEALYRSRGADLRATITELNYWCQIGVGDCRGGFDWFFLRWPRGCDVDERGDVVRVVSEDTYAHGMGWLGRDEISTASTDAEDCITAEEEAIHQSWEHWQLDAGDWSNTPDFRAWAAAEHTSRKPKRRLSSLAALDAFYSTMSDADVCSSGAYRTGLAEPVDAGMPPLPKSTRDDFILGQTLLRAQPLHAHTSPSKAISSTLQSLARQTLSASSARRSKNPLFSPLPPLDEQRTTSLLDHSFHPRPSPLVRHDIALAFDPIAVSPRHVAATHLDPSVFDRPLALIVLDVAPFVRGIVLHDHVLLQRRLRRGEAGVLGRKRMRNTRSALSALEGGERGAIKEKHFGDALAMKAVMRTAGRGWTERVVGEAGQESVASPASDELGA